MYIIIFFIDAILSGISTFLYYMFNSQYYGYRGRVVACVPFYCQIYALGEKTTRKSGFESHRIKYSGRIVSENSTIFMALLIIVANISNERTDKSN